MAQHPARVRQPARIPDLESLNRALTENLKSYPHLTEELLEAALYSVESPGHRWRPILFFGIYEALGGEAKQREILALPCAIEFLHTASIMLDDLPAMDDGMLRRGKLPCHLKFTQARAILAAHWLCDVAQHLVHEYQSRHTVQADLEDLFRALKNNMMHGQTIDLEDRGLTLSETLEKYKLKSGCLYGFTAAAPAHVLGRTGITAHLERFGHYLGIAYQISDDIHDHADAAEVLGKDVRKDGCKSTIPALCGVEHAIQLKEHYKEKAMDELWCVPDAIEGIGDLVEQICL